jgi:LysM repeat protein
MKSYSYLTLSAVATVLASCAASNSDSYDTPVAAAASAAPSSQMKPPTAESSNPVYDTPAAYEESGSTTTAAAAVTSPSVSKPKSAPHQAVAKSVLNKPPNTSSATVHTVVAGDTLSGISAKYKIPVASIRQANNMTKDTVVLGRKMVIPNR